MFVTLFLQHTLGHFCCMSPLIQDCSLSCIVAQIFYISYAVLRHRIVYDHDDETRFQLKPNLVDCFVMSHLSLRLHCHGIVLS